MKLFRPFAAALALNLLLATVAMAQPGLWVARNDHATVYLFGTVHLLPSDTNWKSPALDKALDESQRLSIEIVDDDSASIQTLVMQHGLDLSETLSSKLDEKDRGQLEKAAETAKLPGGMAALQSMRPWLAALTLTMAPLMQAGLDPNQGVDKLIKARMLQAGKPVDGLETAEKQILMLADLPESMQMDFLRQSFKEVAEGPAKLHELIDAWRNGDTAAIARMEDEDLRKDSPVLYQRLIVERNRAWAKTIAERMQQPGVSFVAVGAGHLAGPDSLQEQLRKLGVKTERVQN
ncbi:TraB/GumN family protein [Dyella japonica]|uniref:Polysaccharide biosynthesis protein GumN n=1 Tax=Dyella japonica A8 TaxID=1217721 RepID=A0A075K5S3_9GAMM|nr:TraB/GumN family protein [Dyella japonica]AIF49017.1 polysaccharide biosynthesis protein GumN [Dyella japonica A8]